jgi:hypothetical protein
MGNSSLFRLSVEEFVQVTKDTFQTRKRTALAGMHTDQQETPGSGGGLAPEAYQVRPVHYLSIIIHLSTPSARHT